MKQLEPDLLIYHKQYFIREFVDKLVSHIECIPDSCYVDKSNTIPIRSDGLTGSYRSALNKTIPKNIYEMLKLAAPTIQDHWLEEIVINKYNIGDSIPPHYDKHLYRKFVLIFLSESGDGLTIHHNDKEIFIEDKLGYGLEFTGVDTLHEVKPVKHKRYSLIYLYQ